MKDVFFIKVVLYMVFNIIVSSTELNANNIISCYAEYVKCKAEIGPIVAQSPPLDLEMRHQTSDEAKAVISPDNILSDKNPGKRTTPSQALSTVNKNLTCEAGRDICLKK